ncbi:hypothetical protein FQA39_LY11677 [Lamprigera yunnana]|nr:hypothetical protein FQA39_LY11677 [Lamprigera yunnana]
MCDSEPGPSGIKRPKMIVRNPKNLTEQEMLYFLYNSDYDEDENYKPNTSESEQKEDDVDIIPPMEEQIDEAEQAQIEDSIGTWQDYATSMRNK